MARLSNLPADPLKLCVLRSADQRPLRGQTRGGPWRVNCWLPAARSSTRKSTLTPASASASLREIVNCRRRRCHRPLRHPLGLLSAKHAGWSVARSDDPWYQDEPSFFSVLPSPSSEFASSSKRRRPRFIFSCISFFFLFLSHSIRRSCHPPPHFFEGHRHWYTGRHCARPLCFLGRRS